jgi:hypothetical protein
VLLSLGSQDCQGGYDTTGWLSITVQTDKRTSRPAGKMVMIDLRKQNP